jgi:hypothetical protein
MATQKQILAEINERLAQILAAVTVKKPVSTPFGTPGQTGGGQITPEPKPEPKPEPSEVVWPDVDFSKYTPGTCKSCVTYYGILNEKGYAGLVAEIRSFWDKRETFYQPIKDFIKDYPQFFPCEEDCK